ncbi:GFA family protein, partial [Mesorhizobium sp. M7A.F.Ca.CA.001.08.1.1]
MRIDGGCHCGAITYEAEVDPEKTTICHCTDCQQLTGTAFRLTVPAPESNYRITKGTPKVYIKIVASGAKRTQAFCADCGSHLYATSVGDGPKVYG